MNNNDVDESNMVPSGIRCGGTVYVHIPETGTDIYVAQDHLDEVGGDASEVPADRRWRYCVAKNQDNTVYFSNKATMQSVWVLPDLHAVEGDDEPTMAPQGWTLRARRGSTASAAGSDKDSKPASVVAPARKPLSNVASEGGAPLTAAERVKQQIRARLEASRLARGGSNVSETAASRSDRAPSPAAPDDGVDNALSPLSSHHGSPTAGERNATPRGHRGDAESDGDKASSVGTGSGRRGRQERLEAIRLRRAGESPVGSVGGSSSLPREGSGSEGRVSARDRLAAFRARRIGAATPTESVTRSPDPEPAHQSREPSTFHRVEETTLLAKPTPTPTQHITHASDSPAVAIMQERQRQLLEEDAQLAQQRQAMMAEERLAMERKRRALESQRVEEEALAKVLERRREMEVRRLELAEKEVHPSRQSGPPTELLTQSIQAVEEAMERERAAFAQVEANSGRAAATARAQALQFADSVSAALSAAMEAQQRQAQAEEEERAHEHRLKQRQLALSDRSVAAGAVSADEEAYFGDTLNKVADSVKSPTKSQAPQQLNGRGRVVPGYTSGDGTSVPHRLLLSYNTQLKYLGEVSVTPQEYGRNLLLQRKRQADLAASLIDLDAAVDAVPHADAHLHYTKEGRGVYYYNAKAEGITDDGLLGGQHAPSGTDPASSTFNVHPNAKSYYAGNWDDDRPSDASGVLSAPRSAYQGPIHGGRIDGTGTIQTRDLYGSLSVSNGTPHGTAVIETAAGESFAGAISHGHLSTPGKLSLAPTRAPQAGANSRDEVEWVWRSHAAPGTGRARIRYATGDVFVGEVVDYMPQGSGLLPVPGGPHLHGLIC